MAKNHMSEVAELLEVKLGEVFQVDNCYSIAKEYFRLTENGLEQNDTASEKGWEEGEDWVWVVLLTGNAGIIKMPWKPQDGEQYYIPRITMKQEYMFNVYHWNDNNDDKEYYRMGIVCKTSAEAIKLAKKMLAVAKKD